MIQAALAGMIYSGPMVLIWALADALL